MQSTIKSDLKSIANHLPSNASYEDAMYELYVHMKISQGKKSAEEGRVFEHQEVKRKFYLESRILRKI
jgi:predicted transcriptional regulator